jgi:hypothetical protein
MNHERRAFQMTTSAGVPSAVADIKWNDPASSPVADTKTARKAVFDGCGFDANVMVVSRTVYEVLKQHNEIKAAIKISSEDSRWPQLLAALFDVEQLVVAKAVINNAPEGQDADVSEIWDDSVVLAHVDLSEDLKAVSFGRTFIVADEENPSGVTVEAYRQEELKSTVVRARQMTDEKLTAPAAGFCLKDVLA